jgi:hypothetical protein
MPVFVHDQHSLTVAGIQQGWRRGIVRHSPAVRAHLFELGHTPVFQRIGNADADTSKVLMVTDPFDLDRPFVQIKPGIWVKANRANAERSVNGVDDLAVLHDFGVQSVQRRLRERPKPSVRHRDMLREISSRY